METLVSEDTEKVARKFWAYFGKYAENLGKKGTCCEESNLKHSDRRSGA
jgi:hypothetical protein